MTHVLMLMRVGNDAIYVCVVDVVDVVAVVTVVGVLVLRQRSNSGQRSDLEHGILRIAHGNLEHVALAWRTGMAHKCTSDLVFVNAQGR